MRCATIEEIEAEKSLIEKDVVSIVIFIFIIKSYGNSCLQSFYFTLERKDGKDSWNCKVKFQLYKDGKS